MDCKANDATVEKGFLTQSPRFSNGDGTMLMHQNHGTHPKQVLYELFSGRLENSNHKEKIHSCFFKTWRCHINQLSSSARMLCSFPLEVPAVHPNTTAFLAQNHFRLARTRKLTYFSSAFLHDMTSLSTFST